MGKLNELPSFDKPEGEELEMLRARVHRLEATDADRFEGAEPVSAAEIYHELLEDYENTFNKYYEKRIRLSGIVSKIGPDVFGAPSFEMTDAENSRCYALIVFTDKDIYDKVSNGQTAEVIGNVVFIREPYGLVVKKTELLNAKNIEN